MADDTDVTQDQVPEPATDGIEGQTGDHVDVELTDEQAAVANETGAAIRTEYVPLEQPRTHRRPPVSESVHYQPYE